MSSPVVKDSGLELSNSNDMECFVCQACDREFKISTASATTTDASPKPGNTESVDASAQKSRNNRAAICGACKKFYARTKAANVHLFSEECHCPKDRCPPNPSTDGNLQGRAKKLTSKQLCRPCRARRCLEAIANDEAASSSGESMPSVSQSVSQTQSYNEELPDTSDTPDSPEKVRKGDRINIKMVPCEICGASSSGYHFGVLSCEGCKGFFRRSMAKKSVYKCKVSGKAPISEEERMKVSHQLKCKRCRFEACVRAGMSLSAVQTGRHSMQRKIETSAYVKRLAAENRLLSQPVLRSVRSASSGNDTSEHESRTKDIETESASEALSSTGSKRLLLKCDDDENDDDSEDINDRNLSEEVGTEFGDNIYTEIKPSYSYYTTSSLPAVKRFKAEYSNSPFPFLSQYQPPAAGTYAPLSDIVDDNQVKPSSYYQKEVLDFFRGMPSNSEYQKYNDKDDGNDEKPSFSQSHYSYPQHGASSSDTQALVPVASSFLGNPKNTGTAMFDYNNAPPAGCQQMTFNQNILQHIGAPTPAQFQFIQIGSAHDIANRLLDSSNQLTRINTTPGTQNNFAMNPLAAWTSVMNGLFDRFVTTISHFVRELPGFREVSAHDRIILFTNAYFPILVAQLSLDYDASSRQCNYFCERLPEAREMLKFLLCGTGELLERQLHDVGYTVTSWRPTSLEFSVLCGLVYFDSTLPGLEEPDKIRQIHESYVIADETFNRMRSPADGTTASPSNSMALMPVRPTRFSSLLGYFKPLAQLLSYVMASIAHERPDFVNVHPLYTEMHQYLTGKLETTGNVLNPLNEQIEDEYF